MKHHHNLPVSVIDVNTDDYGLVIHNMNDAGLGLRIRAGDPTYMEQTGTSLAILSIADKNNDNKLVVKASGEVVVFNEFDAKSVITNQVTLKATRSHKLPKTANNGQLMYCSDTRALCFYDGRDWQKIVTEKINET